jgi:ubiquinone/menaquinone biosynthesis C-methylase UbiE
VTREVINAYDGLAQAWALGPSHLYDRLAEEVVSAYPEGVVDQYVLDIGAGTGAISRAVVRLGGRATAVDAAEDMVAHMRTRGLDAISGDLLSLPFDDAAFDGAVAAFSVSHVDDPVQALREARRVVRRGGVVMVAVFAARPANASKEVVDAVAEGFGYVRPSWYERFKCELEPMTNTADALAECARLAGLADMRITERVVSTGIAAPKDIVASRIGMAHLAPFVDALPAPRRRELVAAAVAAVARDPQPLRPVVLIMSSRVRA